MSDLLSIEKEKASHSSIEINISKSTDQTLKDLLSQCITHGVPATRGGIIAWALRRAHRDVFPETAGA